MKRFSWSTFLIGGIVHFAVSVLLPFLVFFAGMGAFEGGSTHTKDSVDGIVLFIWFWCPLPMAVRRFLGISMTVTDMWPFFLVWSLVVGIGLGYLFPRLRRKK